MNQKTSAIFKGLLLRTSETEEHLLTQEQKKELETVHPASTLFHSTLSPLSWLQPIHYSWFYEPLLKLNEKVRAFYLASLTPDQQKGVLGMFKEGKSATLPRFLLPFFAHRLKKMLHCEEVLPVEQLEHTPLLPLFALRKVELVHLIDFLGIYDLAIDLRYIVDTQLLAKIHAALTQEQLLFLHYCAKRAIKWMPPRLNLENWDKEKKSLQIQLHKRGLIRLAKATFEESDSFKWHLVHRLDTGRGKLLTTHFSTPHDPALIPYFQAQVLHLLKRFSS